MKTHTTTIVLLLLNNIAFAQITPEENRLQFKSLQFLYESIENKRKDTLLMNWSFGDTTSINFSTWEGIILDDEGYIAELDISNKGLKAEFNARDLTTFEPTPNMFSLIYLSRLKKLNISNNDFHGNFPFLEYTENPYPSGPQTPIYYVEQLEVLDCSNNTFYGSINIPNFSRTHPNTRPSILKELRVANNEFDFIDIYNAPYLRIIDFRNNKLGLGNFYIMLEDSLTFRLDTLDIRDNKITFSSLWRMSSPDTFVRNFFKQSELKFLYTPQDSVEMKTIVNNKVRVQVGDSIKVDLPDVGQNSSIFPEIRDSLKYQWFKEGIALIADTLSYLKRDSITNNDYGTYFCRITYKEERLRGFSLITESFAITNEVNSPPVISISNDVPKKQRVLKGYESAITYLQVVDDIPLTNPVAARSSTFEITKYPRHLEFINLGNISSIQVRDTSSTWVGIDTVEVTFCDFEGSCTSFQLYYEVYDILHQPPITSFYATKDSNFVIIWDTSIYNNASIKPDGYCLNVSLQDYIQFGDGSYERIDSVVVRGQNIDSIRFHVPEIENHYGLLFHLYAMKNDTLSHQPSMESITIVPAKPDTNLQATIISEGVRLSWDKVFTHTPFYSFSDANNIYWSEDGIDFTLIGMAAYNDTAFTHAISTENRTFYYKLVKITSTVNNLFELPYLESNVIEIRTGNIIPVTGISLNKDTLSLAPSDTDTLIATVIPDSATNRNVAWTSIDENIVTVDNNGLITAIAEGETYIIVTTIDGGYQDSCKVTVINEDIPVMGISLNQHALLLKVDSTETLVATILPNNAINQNVVWESFDENITTVDNNGLITAIAKGETYVVVTSVDGGFQDSCKVRVESDLGVEDLQHQQEELKVYPNPAKNQLIIEKGNLKLNAIEIINTNGSLIKRYQNIQNGQNKITFDISDLVSGIYFVKINTFNGEEVVKKIVKNK